MYVSVRGTPAKATGPSLSGPRVARPVLALGFVSLLTDISSESVTAVLPLYLTAGLGLSMFTYGIVDGLYQGASTLVRIPAAWTSDRLDRPKWVALAGYLLSAVTRLGLLVTATVSGIVAMVALDRVGKGVRTAPRDNLISLASDPTRLGRSFGVHRAMDTLGACLGPVVAFVVLQQLPRGYHVVFVVSLAFALLGLAVLVLLVPDLRMPEAAVRPSVRSTPGRVLGRRTRGLVGVAGLLSVLSVGDGLVYLALVERHGVPALWLPLMAVGTSVAYLLLAVPAGALADRIGRFRMFVLGHVALAATYGVTLVTASGGVSGTVLTVVTLGALGVYYAMTDGLLAAASGEVADPGLRSTTIATTQTVAALGRLASSITFGALWVWVGPTAALLAFVAGLAVAVPLSLLLERRTTAAVHA